MLISIGNYIISGIFIKPGVSNNLNFYFISKRTLPKLANNNGKLDYLATSYNNQNRYVKIHKELLTIDEQHLYDQIIKLI